MTEAGSERAYGRRTFLAVTGAGLSSLLWAKPVWHAVSGAARPLERALPAGIVPSSGWRIYTVAASMPRFDPTMWRLRIEGLVDSPLALTYDELRRLPRAEQVSGFHCVTGWSVKDVRWAGVRFRDLLAAARPQPNAKVLTFVSAERPYVDTLSLSQAGLVHFVRPSADLLFESVASAYADRVIAVVLTGWGLDGATGVSAVKQMGGTVIAQDPAAIGRTAADVLFRRLDGDRSASEQHIVLTRMITRGSGEIRP